ncbi:hypothetical protein ES288_D05G365400v1 [Gossypium darwinii]|uniref:Uncharacterized protein n=2 Tax=Gossypium TaxID=3633 RepID=A0A5D2L3S1_GOSTO|nr:hypothetical protein ES288_D05G365400v1 [Gossypium darwinii]TYH73958.1 hypothetical protein ES332_D05G365300v1 [Gossypium tomentosum]
MEYVEIKKFGSHLWVFLNGSCSIIDKRNLYKKYESDFEEGEGEGVLDPIWRPWGFLFDYIERPNELGFPYWAVSFRASGSFMMKRMSFKRMIRRSCRVEPYSTSQFIWDPADSLFFLFKDQPFVSVFLHREFFADEEISKGLLTSQTDPPTSLYKYWFIKNTQEKHFELLVLSHHILFI